MIKNISEFKVASIQATIFTPGLSFIQSKILGSVLAKWGELFDASPISMPVPNEAPSEIPRIILQSSDKTLKLELASARANLFWFRQSEEDIKDVQGFLAFSTALLCEYVGIVGGRVGRLAAVLIRFFEEENPGLFLAQHFCKESLQEAPFDRPESFELHARKRYLLAEKFNINSWVRCKSGFVTKPTRKSAVLIEQDINTLAEETDIKEFDSDQISDFYSLVPDEFDAILSLYFPQEA